MPNVTSETHRKWWFWLLFPLAAAMNFGYLFLLLLQRLLLLLLLVPGWENTMAVKDGEAHCTPKMPNVTSENPLENDDFGGFYLLLLLWILATFSSCCCRGFCCCCWSPDKKTPWQWRTEKPQNCTPKMPNVTSETHRKWWFWLLFPLAAAMNMKFGYLFLLLLQRLLLLLLVPGWENTMAVKDGEAPKLHPENA